LVFPIHFPPRNFEKLYNKDFKPETTKFGLEAHTHTHTNEVKKKAKKENFSLKKIMT